MAGDGDANGLFTENLKRVYNNGSFRGNYLAFVQEIDTQMPPYQKPSYQLMGAVIPNVDFDGQQPFKLGP